MEKHTVIPIGFMALIFASLVFQMSTLSMVVDNKLLDFQYAFFRERFPRTLHKDIVIIGIDQQTLETYREPLALWHPHLARFFEAMTVAKPSVVGLDLILPDRSYDFLVEGYDKKLLAGLLKLKSVAPVVLGQTINQKGELRSLFAPLVSIMGKNSLGLVLVNTDSDGIIRRFSSSVRFEKENISTLAPTMAMRLGLPVNDGFINYSYGEAFNYIPLQQVNTWLKDRNFAQLDRIFKNKPVIVGSVLPFIDRHQSPLTLADWEAGKYRIPGVLIQAQIFRSLISQSTLQRINEAVVYGLLILSTLIYWLGHRPKLAVPLTGLMALVLGVVSTLLFWYTVILPVVTAILVALTALISRMGLEGVFAFIEKRRLESSFGGYVSPNVLNEILDGRITPHMVGEKRTLCVLFSDIRNFTTRSESQSPEEIISLLNRYFREMTSVVHTYGGTVDKFIGDGLMVFFGAPNQLDNPAQKAFDTAKEMLQRLDILNQKLVEEGIEKIQIGIGMHLGQAVVGHVGSRVRHEYTAIGDTVNLAARLESKTKELGYSVICSATVANVLKSSDGLVCLGDTPIKGRAAVKVYGWKPV